jgi:hypothetical protein
MRFSTVAKERSTRRGKVWTFLALTVVACTGSDTIVGTPTLDTIVGTPTFDALDESLPTGIHARLVTGPFAAGRQTVHVVLQAREVDFSSYQGVVDFDQKALGLISVSAPKTDTHLFNRTAAASEGLPIAGFAVDGFDEPIVITLNFATPRTLRTGDLTVHLDVVGTSIGTEVPPARLYENRELIPEGAR